MEERAAEVVALDVMERIRLQNESAWCEAEEAGELDGDSLLEFLTSLISLLLPIVVKRRAPA